MRRGRFPRPPRDRPRGPNLPRHSGPRTLRYPSRSPPPPGAPTPSQHLPGSRRRPAASRPHRRLQVRPHHARFAASWALPLAARAAHRIGDRAVEQQVLDLLDSYRRPQLPPMLRAERDLVAARLTADDEVAADLLATAVAELREGSTPFHLGHGLVDLAEHLAALGRWDAAGPLLTEATALAEELGAAPLEARARAVSAQAPVSLPG